MKQITKQGDSCLGNNRNNVCNVNNNGNVNNNNPTNNSNRLAPDCVFVRMQLGIFLGSIITQLLGVGTLDKLDHIIKEKFKIRHYSRYNDDMIMISKNKDELVKLLFYINEYLKNLGLTLNLNKTKIYKITDKIEFIGFDFRLTNTGYVVVTVPKHKVKYKKRKLRRMVKAANEGKFDKSTVDQHFKSYIQHISYGDTNKLQLNLTVYYNELWPDEPKLKIHDIQKEFKKPKMKNTYKLKNAA